MRWVRKFWDKFGSTAAATPDEMTQQDLAFRRRKIAAPIAERWGLDAAEYMDEVGGCIVGGDTAVCSHLLRAVWGELMDDNAGLEQLIGKSDWHLRSSSLLSDGVYVLVVATVECIKLTVSRPTVGAVATVECTAHSAKPSSFMGFYVELPDEGLWLAFKNQAADGVDQVLLLASAVVRGEKAFKVCLGTGGFASCYECPFCTKTDHLLPDVSSVILRRSLTTGDGCECDGCTVEQNADECLHIEETVTVWGDEVEERPKGLDRRLHPNEAWSELALPRAAMTVDEVIEHMLALDVRESATSKDFVALIMREKEDSWRGYTVRAVALIRKHLGPEWSRWYIEGAVADEDHDPGHVESGRCLIVDRILPRMQVLIGGGRWQWKSAAEQLYKLWKELPRPCGGSWLLDLHPFRGMLVFSRWMHGQRAHRDRALSGWFVGRVVGKGLKKGTYEILFHPGQYEKDEAADGDEDRHPHSPCFTGPAREDGKTHAAGRRPELGVGPRSLALIDGEFDWNTPFTRLRDLSLDASIQQAGA